MARSKLSMEGSVRNRLKRKKKGFFNNHNNNHATFQNGHLETGHFETASTGEVKSGIRARISWNSDMCALSDSFFINFLK
uniref:Uncharacterized protein n=1 Tax=Caenorhabditis japonica TaxID=281687 RepID=A0A8R1IBX6_CAEJA